MKEFFQTHSMTSLPGHPKTVKTPEFCWSGSEITIYKVMQILVPKF